jgi:hypothetical protein
MTALKQWIAVTVTTIAIVGTTAGCSGGQMENRPTQEPADAKRSIQQLVDDTTDALGGTWTVQEGPRLGTCEDERGVGEGVNYTYIKSRADRGDVEQGIRTLEKLWGERGLDTKRFSDADASYSGVDGSGDGVANIGFQSSDLGGGDTVSGTSACAAGDYVKMRERERS